MRTKFWRARDDDGWSQSDHLRRDAAKWICACGDEKKNGQPEKGGACGHGFSITGQSSSLKSLRSLHSAVLLALQTPKH